MDRQIKLANEVPNKHYISSETQNAADHQEEITQQSDYFRCSLGNVSVLYVFADYL